VIQWRSSEAPAIFRGVTAFSPPDFSTPRLASAPDATFVPAPADGVLPDRFFSTTNLPTYVRVAGSWRLPREPRMDSALVLDSADVLWVREGRRVKAGERVAVGTAEDGSEGIYVHTTAFLTADPSGEFKFMTSDVSREKPIEYAVMARLLIEERSRGGCTLAHARTWSGSSNMGSCRRSWQATQSRCMTSSRPSSARVSG
jgi:hypothetical protein